MFHDIVDPSIRVGSRKALVLPLSIVAHVALVAVALLVPLMAPSVLPTFGGAVHPALGLLLWWLLVFAAACGYAAWLFPWGDKDFGWPGGDA